MSGQGRGVSRRQFLGFGVAAIVGGALGACGGDGDDSTADVTPTASPSSTVSPAASVTVMPSATVPPTATVPTISIDEKIGQMVLAGFRGLRVGPQEALAERLRAGSPGNLVLFDFDTPSNGVIDRNIQSPAQLKELTRELQGYAPRTLLIATDQEGGMVARLSPKWGFPATYSAKALGDRNDPAFTREAGRAMAETLAANGINLNLAPVVDVNVNPDNPVIGRYERSFSAEPDVVTAQALAFIEGHHDAGVLTTLKHFPGHGSSTADSHKGFVDVTNLWSRFELEPFRNVIASGKADAVMTAHIFNANLDPDYPATLSKATITGLLREELGFEGVVITDDMQMGAIRDFYGFEAAVELAINAGADLVSISNNLTYEDNLEGRTFVAIKKAVDAGRISSERIDESFRRIGALKERVS
jgi:beta-N-acetylhexosaminidase